MMLSLWRSAVLVASVGLLLSLPGARVRAAEVIQIPDRAAAKDTVVLQPKADDAELADETPDFDNGAAVLSPAWFFDGNGPFGLPFFSQNNSKPSVVRQRRQSRQTQPRHQRMATVRPRPMERERDYSPTRHYKGSYKRRVATMLRKGPASERAKGPLLFTISLSRQSIKVYDAGVEIAHGPVSTGMPGHPTPMGVFSVLEREWWHRSNLYSGAPMPFMQRLTWSGIAMHAGELPGYPASHGCIRMPENLALRLWHLSGVGARVVIARNELTPEDIDHPVLFQPHPTTPLPMPAPMSRPLPPEDAPVSMNDFDRKQAQADAERDHMMLAAADDGETLADEDTNSARPQLEFAFVLSELEGAQQDQPLLHLLSTHRKFVHRGYVKPPEAEYAEIYKSTGSISVFVSRRDSRIYVRKNAQPLFDLPVTINWPEKPVGTHVFTAVADQAGDKLRWMVVSPADPALSGGRDTAQLGARAALDRLSIPQEAVEQIEALVSVGATMIVSDAGLGKTAIVPNADFAVVLH